MFQPKTEAAVMTALKAYGPGPGAAKMLEWEFQHAQEAMESGVYVTYESLVKKQECFRVGSNSRCFCGHLFAGHQKTLSKKKLNTACEKCECKGFQWIPRRPEEVGMYWLVRRKGFDAVKWRAPCKCKHTHEEHSCKMTRRCKKCGCFEFAADFACLSCDGAYHDHELVYQLEHDRMQAGKPIREAFYPLSDTPAIQAEFIAKMHEKPAAKAIKAAGEALGVAHGQEEEAKALVPSDDPFIQFELNPVRPAGAAPVTYVLPKKMKEEKLRPPARPAVLKKK